MIVSKAMRTLNNHLRNVEQWSDYDGWIALRVADLIDAGFDRPNANRIAKKEWHDGLGCDVELCDDDHYD